MKLFHWQLNEKVDANNFATFSEFDCSNGIADLVAVRLSANWQNHRSIGAVQPRWLYALWSLPYRKGFSVTDFSVLAGVSRRRALAALNEFSNANYCEKLGAHDHWAKVRQPQKVANEILAVEAKLNNWRRALVQANRYLDFANQAWVLVDRCNVRSPIANISDFHRLGIGLASISLSREVFVHYHPVSTAPRSNMRMWQANSLIAASIRSTRVQKRSHL